MKLISAFSHCSDESEAVIDLSSQIPDDIYPSLILCYFTEEYSAKALKNQLTQQFPDTPIQGCTSCRGILTEKGFHRGPVVGLMILADSQSTSAYGTGISDGCLTSAAQNTKKVLREAIQNSGRVGELPSLIIVHATPGFEEPVIDAIYQEFGTLVPLIGGSAADHSLEGKWHVFTEQATSQEGISISVLFPSSPCETGFHTGYSTTGVSGEVTKVGHRSILEIDHKPALDVYQTWCQSLGNHIVDEQSLFATTNLFPLGRIVGSIDYQPIYKLSHPVKTSSNGEGIELFTEIAEGERVHLMTGSKERLISRAGKVIQLTNDACIDMGEPLGAINIFCAGSMLHIESAMNTVCEQVHSALKNQPFICPFTYGEQGRFENGINAHGNLMVSSVVFHQSKRV
ncbi:FIST signal transduction protein [Vibrio nigripulchritudo]|uniref:FIST signal transduction protein n=1 Tax=Vibrio nigripulchritudo TaxID=28173 RepID=UPI0024918255|nr:FIST N-terminal domain-containing protein [Vibrio nigripulchritudo]BDU37186.1 histidine kinase [Vibrio nigripulchritudo]BDU42906.1 histidine kinase [Vibrio nigripulchritudo]